MMYQARIQKFKPVNGLLVPGYKTTSSPEQQQCTLYSSSVVIQCEKRWGTKPSNK